MGAKHWFSASGVIHIDLSFKLSHFGPNPGGPWVLAWVDSGRISGGDTSHTFTLPCSLPEISEVLVKGQHGRQAGMCQDQDSPSCTH